MWGWGWDWGTQYLGVGLLPSWFGTSVFFVDVFRSSHLSSGGEGRGGRGGGGGGFVVPVLRYFLIVSCCWRICFLFL
jgi:hypothetical protein